MVIILVLLIIVGLICSFIWYYNKMASERQAEMLNQQMEFYDGQSIMGKTLKSLKIGDGGLTVGTNTTPTHLSPLGQKSPSKKTKKTKSKRIPSAIRLQGTALPPSKMA